MEHRSKLNVVWLSVASNTVLVLGKLVIGLAMGSVAVLSESLHSAIDLLAAIIALVAVRISSRPADRSHPFGHGKAENISGTIEAILIFIAAGCIIQEAIRKIIHPEPIDVPWLGVAVMAVSSIVNIIVSRRLFVVGKRTDSVAIQADAWHLLTDVYTSAGVMVGLGAIWVGQIYFPQWSGWLVYIDPVVAIVVAVAIIRAAWKLTVDSASDLMDVGLPVDEQNKINEIISTFDPSVRGFHRVRTRKAGASRFIEFHIFVDGRMSVDESHSIAHALGDKIREQLRDAHVTVHVEPCTGDCGRVCSEGCLLDQEQRKAIHDERCPDRK